MLWIALLSFVIGTNAQQCFPNGTVTILSGNQCVCKEGFVGLLCSYECPGRGTTNGICSGRGTCSDYTTPPYARCTCAGEGVKGTNCEAGCEVVHGNVCNGNQSTCVPATNTTLEYCQCSGNFRGLSCTTCQPGYYGSTCNLKCPGRPMPNGAGWDGCYASEGHGTCDTTTNPSSLTCSCNPPYITESCASTHYGLPAPESVMSPLWATFQPRTAVMNDTITLTFRGYRTSFPESLPAMKVKVSSTRGTCVGMATGSTEGTVEPTTRTATFRAPSANATYSVCLKWRRDWELVRNGTFGTAGAGVDLVVTNPVQSKPFHGYATCAELVKVMNATKYCGCHYSSSGAGTIQTELPMDYYLPAFLGTSSVKSINQGCCWGRPAVEMMGSDWGLCLAKERFRMQ